MFSPTGWFFPRGFSFIGGSNENYLDFYKLLELARLNFYLTFKPLRDWHSGSANLKHNKQCSILGNIISSERGLFWNWDILRNVIQKQSNNGRCRFFEIRNTCVRINGASRSCCAAAKRDATKLEKRAWNYNCSGIGPVDIFDQSNFSAFYSSNAVINVNLLFPPPSLSPPPSSSSSPSSSWVADQRHRSCRVTRLSVWVAHISIQPSCNP